MGAKKTFILHDESVNTQGFRMLTSGADLSIFKSNPVMLLNHNDWDLPIGKWENIRIEGTQILADADFDENDERVKTILDKVERGYLKAASIGAWPPLETSTDPLLMLPGQELPTVTKWIVREASICTIGSNHNALALYDKENRLINMADAKELIRLLDTQKVSPQNNRQMTILTGLLNLSDSASEQAIADEVRKIIALRDTLQAENTTLKTTNQALSAKVEGFEKKEKETRNATAIQLVDTAIKDGRLDAKGKEAWLKMFDSNYDQAAAQLEAIPTRGSVAAQVQPAGGKKENLQLSDMSFSDILKADRLKELKKDPELYKQKFFEAYGKYPS